MATPRHLPLRHARRLLHDPPPTPTDPNLKPLDPGFEQLLSFYAPSLTAGLYTATARQTVTAPTSDPPLKLTTAQSFTVTAPRFALPDGAIHSTYPPQGHGDHVEILPHMVFNDAHLPWERQAAVPSSSSSSSSSSAAPPQPDTRNRVPWLALLSFTANELAIAPADLTAGGIFDGTSLKKPVVQSSTMTVSMSVVDLLATAATATPIKVVNADATEPVPPSTMTSAVFLPPALFTSLFTTDGAGVTADVERYKYLSHARSINTTGMAAASAAGNSGVFSVVVSHRTGPVDATQAAPVIVHLVSIEGVPGMAFPLPAGTRYVAMTSLHSWSYTCLPPTADNIYQTLETLGAGRSVLRAPDTTINTAAGMSPRLAARLKDGYTLVRYRVQTGEETAALLRGALTPTTVTRPLIPSWTSLSNSGMDLQVLDQEVGLMDITYSAAWQLGRTLGMADRAFATALARVRGAIFDGAMNMCKIDVLSRIPGAHRTREETLREVVKGFETLRGLSGGGKLHAPRGMMRRWWREAVEIPDLSFGGENITAEMFGGHARTVARGLAASTDGGVYNENNSPASTDWMAVLKWVIDKLYLYGIPAQYLISDPSHLPAESLRFFTIDGNWTDALLDGALSLANHSVDTTDQARIAIKTAINEYLTTPLPSPAGYLPQVPSYGFLLRSQAVVQFPDLVVTTSPAPADGRAAILRHENIADDVVLCLFDREPGSSAFKQLTFSQPPHQQAFVAAAEVTADLFTTSYKRVYTQANPDDKDRGKELCKNTWYRKDGAKVFDWDTRTLVFPAWAVDVYTTISEQMRAKVGPDAFVDTEATAALCGIQLNNPIYSLNILTPPDPTPPAALRGLSGAAAGPRTLLLLDAPKRPRVPLHTRRAAMPPLPPPIAHDITVPPLPPPSSRTRLTPLSTIVPPPHHRRPLSAPRSSRMTAPRLIPQTPPRVPGPAHPPVFKYTVTPAAAFGPIPTGLGKQDLVFGVILTSGAQYQYRLQSIELALPLGAMSNVGPPTFAQSYDGPGAAMLSNLRFNVAVEFGQDQMVLRLVPRTTKGVVPVSVCGEVSFGLGLVQVNAWAVPKTVGMRARERWEWGMLEYWVGVDLVPGPGTGTGTGTAENGA